MKPVSDPDLINRLNQGLKPVSDPKILAKLNGEDPKKSPTRPPGLGMFNLFNRAKDAVQGDAEFKAEAIPQFLQRQDPKQQVQMAGLERAFQFGNEKDVVNQLDKLNIPVQKDANGNAFFMDGDKPVYLDQPGADAWDMISGTQTALPYVAGGQATGAIKALAPRVLATGAVETGIDAAVQKEAGRDLDVGQALTAGALGAGFETLGPLISKLWRAVKNPASGNIGAGKQIAKRLNMGDLSDEQLHMLGNYARNLDDSIDVDNIAQHVELNQRPTLGTLTKDQDILETEDMLRNAGRESTQAKLKRVDRQNELGLEKSFDDFQASMSGGTAQSVDTLNAAGKVQQNVLVAEETAKKAVNEAYGAVGSPVLGTEGFKKLPGQVKRALSDADIFVSPNNTPKAMDAIEGISKDAASLENTSQIKWNAVDSYRKKLGSLFSNASKEDRRALTAIHKSYDEAVSNAFENELLSGGPEAYENLLKARSVAHDYFKKFSKGGKHDIAGGTVEKWLNADVDPKNVANAIINTSGTFSANAGAMARRYLKIVGKGTDEHNVLKEMIIHGISKNHAGQKARTHLRTQLQKSLAGTGTGDSFLNDVFTKKELGFLSRTVSFLDETTLKGKAAKSSGTTERFFRWVNNAAGNDVSLSGLANTMKKALTMFTGGESRLLNLPMKRVNTGAVSGLVASQGKDDADL